MFFAVLQADMVDERTSRVQPDVADYAVLLGGRRQRHRVVLLLAQRDVHERHQQGLHSILLRRYVTQNDTSKDFIQYYFDGT